MFAVVLPGRPCLTSLTTLSTDPPKFALSIPAVPKFSHIVVFMLPGTVLPAEAAAAVYVQFPGQQEFKLLGALGNEKQSVIFKVNIPGLVQDEDAMTDASGLGTDAAPGSPDGAVVNLGISIELASAVEAQLASTKETAGREGTMLTKYTPPSANSSNTPSTKVLAQRIIQNAYNFLSSFSGTMANGQEVIPLKSFQDWWQKFERRVQNDPGFLERPQD